MTIVTTLLLFALVLIAAVDALSAALARPR
jgi:hypothetical protein